MNLRYLATTVAFLATGFIVPNASAEEASPVVKITPSGQYMARARFSQNKDFASDTNRESVRHRARLGLKFDFGPTLSTFVQVQDVRVWGEETNTLGDFSADGLDLHQGYLDAKHENGFRLRIGRQEIAYLNHRLIGTVGFVEQARSFDAIRISYTPADSPLVADFFYARLVDNIPAASTASDNLFAGMATYTANPAFIPSVTVVADTSAADIDRTRVTVGVHVKGKVDSGLHYEVEGYYQAGSMAGDVSIAAWMAAANAKYAFGGEMKPFVKLFGEFLSGDDDPTDADIKSFDTLFATNHKFYGEMDFFLNIPGNTGQRGLMDVGLAAGLQPLPELAAMVTFHNFQAMDDQGGAAAMGQEIDTKLVLKPMKHLSLDFVYGVFLPGDGNPAGNGDPDVEHFFYTTVNAKF
ncbi:MAG: hypothetical protein ACI9MR_000509 [Myxococcota bacterium]|jgi:hypothetical protein